MKEKHKYKGKFAKGILALAGTIFLGYFVNNIIKDFPLASPDETWTASNGTTFGLYGLESKHFNEKAADVVLSALCQKDISDKFIPVYFGEKDIFDLVLHPDVKGFTSVGRTGSYIQIFKNDLLTELEEAKKDGRNALCQNGDPAKCAKVEDVYISYNAALAHEFSHACNQNTINEAKADQIGKNYGYALAIDPNYPRIITP